MSLSRTIHLFDMAVYVDTVDAYATNRFYTFTGSIPAWFDTYIINPLLPTRKYPNFYIAPPQGTTGTWSFTANKFDLSSTLLDSGTITIVVDELEQTPWVLGYCAVAAIVWLNPIGGWQTYIFASKQTPFQDQGTAETHITNRGEKRYTSRDEVHQGVLIGSGQMPPEHADDVASLFKSVQAYLWLNSGQALTIIIDPQSFRRARTSEPNVVFEFEFRYAAPDVIQTQ